MPLSICAMIFLLLFYFPLLLVFFFSHIYPIWSFFHFSASHAHYHTNLNTLHVFALCWRKKIDMNTISPRMLFLREFRTHNLIQPHTNNLDPTCYRLERTQQALHVHSIEEKVINFIQKHWLLGFMNIGLSKFPLLSHAHTLLQGITTCTPTQ